MYNILFVDIDGVIRPIRPIEFFAASTANHLETINRFSASAVNNLKSIISSCRDLKVVISSSWRLDRSLDELKAVFALIDVDPEIIMDATPIFCPANRCREIQHWIDSNRYLIRKFVILEDFEDMTGLTQFVVRTESDIGITANDATAVINYFNGGSRLLSIDAGTIVDVITV